MIQTIGPGYAPDGKGDPVRLIPGDVVRTPDGILVSAELITPDGMVYTTWMTDRNRKANATFRSCDLVFHYRDRELEKRSESIEKSAIRDIQRRAAAAKRKANKISYKEFIARMTPERREAYLETRRKANRKRHLLRYADPEYRKKQLEYQRTWYARKKAGKDAGK